MANRRRKFPTFFSFEIGPVRGIAESMGDAEWGTWSKKALSDLSIGCIRKDTDPRVKDLFNSSKDRMDSEYQRKHDWYEKKKMAGATTREDGESKSDSGNAGNLGSATPAKPSLAYSGKNGLVRLTDDEYNILLAEMGNKRDADRLIDSLDYALAEGRTYQQPHLHVLTHWKAYRDEKKAEAAEVAKVSAEARAEANKKHGYKTHADKMDEMVEGAKHLIQMYSLPEVKNG